MFNVISEGPKLRTLYIFSATSELSAEQLATQPLAGALFAVETDAQGVAPKRFGG